MGEWTREKQLRAMAAREDGADLSLKSQDAMLAEIERAWGEIERAREQERAAVLRSLAADEREYEKRASDPRTAEKDRVLFFARASAVRVAAGRIRHGDHLVSAEAPAPLTEAVIAAFDNIDDYTAIDSGEWYHLSKAVDALRASRGDIPEGVRDGHALTTTPDHATGESALVPTLTREEAARRLDALSPTAVRHLDTARDWLAAYELSQYRDPLRDEMAKILRAYVAGLDAQGGAK